jgi:transcription termination factor NusB
MKKKTDPRHGARMLAVQKLFIKHFASKNNNVEDSDVQILKEVTEQKDFDSELFDKILAGVEELSE